jgi:hypothetical protein
MRSTQNSFVLFRFEISELLLASFLFPPLFVLSKLLQKNRVVLNQEFVGGVGLISRSPDLIACWQK